MIRKRVSMGKLAVVSSAVFIMLIAVLIAVAVEQAPLLIADGLGAIADAYFEGFAESTVSEWLNEDYMYLSQYADSGYRYYDLALAVSFYYRDSYGDSMVIDHHWNDYLACFNAESEAAVFDAVYRNYGYEIAESDQSLILGFAAEVRRLNGNGEYADGRIYTIDEITIDFGSKYYTFSSDIAAGNPCVCDENNNVAWPYNRCIVLSYFHEFNKMICTSYAAGRYWEVNYPDDSFPLPLNWDAQITLRHRAPGNGIFSMDTSHPIARSIISIHHAGGNHDAFIESVAADGSVIISECNASSERPYGFRVRRFNSLQNFLDSYGPGTYLNGMYGG